MTFPKRPQPNANRPTPRPSGEKPPMLLQAIEIHYDYNNKRVSAVGNVQIYYNGTTARSRQGHLRRDHQAHAGRRQRAAHRAGRQDHLRRTHGSERRLPRRLRRIRCVSTRPTRPAWRPRAPTGRAAPSRVLHSGVYTACEPCKDDPKKPPLWQVKAARMIHDQAEKMIYFEDARLEFFGKPVAYMPYFSAPDPTVKRKSGFLMPIVCSSGVQRLSASRCRTTGRWRRTTTSR